MDQQYKRSQAKKRDFDTRVELEVQIATSAMKIEMVEKLSEAKKEMKVMDKKLTEAKKDMEAMEKKLLKAKMDMEANIADKVKAGIQAYLDSFGITISENIKSYSNEQVPDNSIEDRQQSLSPVSVVHTKKFRQSFTKVLIFISCCLNPKNHMTVRTILFSYF